MQNRRTFWLLLLTVAVISVAGMITTSVLGAPALQAPKMAVALRGLPALASRPIPAGTTALTVNGIHPKNILLSRDAAGTWHAFSDRSAHLGEQVIPWPEHNGFVDPFHGSVYDRNGKNIAGPAPRGLDWYPVSIDGDFLVIDLSQPHLGA